MISHPTGPLVSVIVSSYNYAKFIDQAIRSIFGQTYRNFEVIIVDDASTDDSPDIISRATKSADIETIVILRRVNGGQAAAWNDAFAACKGDVICFLDSDDYWYPTKLEALVRFMAQFPGGAVYQHQLDTDLGVKRGGLLSADVFGLLRAWDNGTFNIADDRTGALFSPFVPTSGLGFRREALQRVFPIPDEIKSCPDAYLTRTSIAFGALVSIPESLGVWRLHGANAGLTDQADFAKYWRPVILPALNRFYAKNNLGLRLEYNMLTRSRVSAGIMLGEYQRLASYQNVSSYKSTTRGARSLSARVLRQLQILAGSAGRAATHSPPAPPPDPAALVDVVVTVHNALRTTQQCLDSVLRAPDGLGQLILVNDGSDAETSAYLEAFARMHPNVTRIRNESPLGYTKAANQGLRASSSDHVILLNSDTIVSSKWLWRLLECAKSDPKIGVVGPLSNAASYQSIPERRAPGGGWAVNRLALGLSVDDMATLVARLSQKRFPRVPFVNGFCYLIARRVIDTIGLLDEETFPLGYGEEDDYSVRARAAGFMLAIADHCYVYHEKSASFGHDTRKQLSQQGHAALRAKHGTQQIDAGVRDMESLREIDELAHRLQKSLDSGEIRAMLDRGRTE